MKKKSWAIVTRLLRGRSPIFIGGAEVENFTANSYEIVLKDHKGKAQGRAGEKQERAGKVPVCTTDRDALGLIFRN